MQSENPGRREQFFKLQSENPGRREQFFKLPNWHRFHRSVSPREKPMKWQFPAEISCSYCRASASLTCQSESGRWEAESPSQHFLSNTSSYFFTALASSLPIPTTVILQITCRFYIFASIRIFYLLHSGEVFPCTCLCQPA